MACERNAGQVAKRGASANGIDSLSNRAVGAKLAGRRDLPQIKTELLTKTEARIRLEPLPEGYGITLGNAMRRTLLSDIKGAAVTAFKVEGITHEFSTLPHLREDMTALALNTKQIRFAFSQDKPAELQLAIRGEGPLRAGDLLCPPHVKVTNPDLLLATADSDQAKLDISFWAQPGRGYEPAGERRDLEPGTIPLDAVYTPVRRANFKVQGASLSEQVRAGQGYEKLLLEVKTDGSRSPESVLREGSALLGQQFSHLAYSYWDADKRPLPPVYQRALADIDLKPRTLSRLQEAGYDKLLPLMKELRQDPEAIRSLPGLGRQSFKDLIESLQQQKLSQNDQDVLAHIDLKRRVRQKGGADEL